MHHERNEEHADGRTEHSERHEARLDKVTRIVGGDNGTHHEADDGKSEVVLQRIDRLRTRNVLEHEGEHLSHGPEHRKRDDGGTERTVAPAEAQAAARDGELDLAVLVPHLGDKEARDRPEHAHAGQNPRYHDRLREDEADSLIAD